MSHFDEIASTNMYSEADRSIISEDKESGKRKDRLKGVVTRIGSEPLLRIEGFGEIRFAYRNVKKKHGDSRPFIQVGDNVECRLTKSSPPKAVSVRLLKKVDAEDAYDTLSRTVDGVPLDMRDTLVPTRFAHDPYQPTAADKNLSAVLNDSPQLCNEIDACDVAAAINGCLNGNCVADLGDYYPSSSKKITDDSCVSGDEHSEARCQSPLISSEMLSAYCWY